jgi:hypothetical protein
MDNKKEKQQESKTTWSKSTLEALKRMGFNHSNYEG